MKMNYFPKHLAFTLLCPPTVPQTLYLHRRCNEYPVVLFHKLAVYVESQQRI